MQNLTQIREVWLLCFPQFAEQTFQCLEVHPFNHAVSFHGKSFLNGLLPDIGPESLKFVAGGLVFIGLKHGIDEEFNLKYKERSINIILVVKGSKQSGSV